ncbi:type II toxin-antitoxin system YoeB family toxin [Verrucosispora sp. WMMD1129]|nr:type II toxin-antitoxin system YoeB family toxin [Verrucosispora sp. WMMD1129]WFE48587.1 type II toxin-antitoxin system YoeB family toxin [Verrucosispora sp. WMMD1129]
MPCTRTSGATAVRHREPERVRGNWSGFWSRRIDQERRLVYRIVDQPVSHDGCGTDQEPQVREYVGRRPRRSNQSSPSPVARYPCRWAGQPNEARFPGVAPRSGRRLAGGGLSGSARRVWLR